MWPFKRKPQYKLDLIKETEGRISISNPTLKYSLDNLHDTYKIYNDQTYVKLLDHYNKYYRVYDLNPQLLEIKAVYMFYYTNKISNLDINSFIEHHILHSVDTLISNIDPYLLPNDKLVDCVVEMYSMAVSYMGKPFSNISKTNIKTWIYFTYLSNWEKLYIKGNLSKYIRSYIDYHIGLLIVNSPENTKTIVKNIIERHILKYIELSRD